AIAVEIESAIDREVSLREAERAPPRCGCFGQGHPRPKLNVKREHAFIRKAAVGFGAEQEMISAKGAIEQPPGLPGRAGVFLFARQAEQPTRGGVDVDIVLGRHPGEFDLLRIVTMEAAAKTVAA